MSEIKNDFMARLEKAGVDAIEATTEFMRTSKDFASEQIPLYVQELLTWGFWDAIISCVFCLATALLSLAIMTVVFKKFRAFLKHENDPVFAVVVQIFVIIICLTVLALPIKGFIMHGKEAIKIKVAPRVYLVDEVSKQINQRNP
jgi:H+/Cl- antiporter ClcA